MYYATNILGYGLMYLGVRDLKAGNEQMGKVQPLVLVMIFHSVFFLVLNSTGYSAGSIPLSTVAGFALSMSLLALAVAGTIMIPFILSAFISASSSRLSSVSRLERLVGAHAWQYDFGEHLIFNFNFNINGACLLSRWDSCCLCNCYSLSGFISWALVVTIL